MTESVYEPDDGGIANDEAVDLDQEFGDDDVDAVYETGYSPPDHEPSNTRFGTTWAEENRGETLDQRLAQETPDPALAEDPDSDLEGDELDEVDDVAEDALGDGEDLVDGEVGGARAGRLVDPEEGIGPDTEKDLIGRDVGIDEGAASAEEAAVHIVDE